MCFSFLLSSSPCRDSNPAVATGVDMATNLQEMILIGHIVHEIVHEITNYHIPRTNCRVNTY